MVLDPAYIWGTTHEENDFEQRKGGEMFTLMMGILSQAWFGSLQVDLHTAAEWTDVIGCQEKVQSAGGVWWMIYIEEKTTTHSVPTILLYDFWFWPDLVLVNEYFWNLRHILLIKTIILNARQLYVVEQMLLKAEIDNPWTLSPSQRLPVVSLLGPPKQR